MYENERLCWDSTDPLPQHRTNPANGQASFPLKKKQELACAGSSVLFSLDQEIVNVRIKVILTFQAGTVGEELTRLRTHPQVCGLQG